MLKEFTVLVLIIMKLFWNVNAGFFGSSMWGVMVSYVKAVCILVKYYDNNDRDFRTRKPAKYDQKFRDEKGSSAVRENLVELVKAFLKSWEEAKEETSKPEQKIRRRNYGSTRHEEIDTDTKKSMRRKKNYGLKKKIAQKRNPPPVLRQDEEVSSASPSETTKRNNVPEMLTPYDLISQMKRMLKDHPHANVTMHSIGRTAEYNDILLLKVEKKSVDNATQYFRAAKYVEEPPDKKIVLIVHGLAVMGMNIHTYTSLLNFKNTQRLMSYYFNHLDKFDIYFIPLANPDGVVTRNLMWNKNISPQAACPGVALDRNFDVSWKNSPVSSCSQNYAGPTPFSEPESRAIRDLFNLYSQRIVAYIHVHHGTYNVDTYKGDAVLYPKGYSDMTTDDDKYIDVRAEIEDALRNASFKLLSVAVEPLHSWYGGIVTGTSVDYASTVYGIPYAFEFVVQLYEDIRYSEKKYYSYYAMIEIWQRIVDSVFNAMHKGLKTKDDTAD